MNKKHGDYPFDTGICLQAAVFFTKAFAKELSVGLTCIYGRCEMIFPLIGSFKRMSQADLFLFSCFFLHTIRLQNIVVFALSRGPGGVRELREACWNHFHLSWYLSNSMAPIYDQETSYGGIWFSVYTFGENPFLITHDNRKPKSSHTKTRIKLTQPT